MKPEQRCIILIRIDNVLNHYPPIHIFSDSRSFLRKICTSLCNNPITALFLQSSMENVRRSFTYTMILICRRTWRLWNHGLRKVPIWKMLDKVPDSFKTVQCNEHRFAFFWIPHFGSFFRRRQASPVPPRLQVQSWEDKGETWPLQLVQVETNLNAMSYFLSGGKV